MDGSTRLSGTRQHTWSTATSYYSLGKENRKYAKSQSTKTYENYVKPEGAQDTAGYRLPLESTTPESADQCCMAPDFRQGRQHKKSAVDPGKAFPAQMLEICTNSKSVQTSFTFPSELERRGQIRLAEYKKESTTQLQSDDECMTGSPTLQFKCTVPGPEPSGPFGGTEMSRSPTQGGAVRQCNPPCNEASLQHLARHTKVTGCTTSNTSGAANRDFKLAANPLVPQHPMDSLRQRSSKVEWDLANQQQECISTPTPRYPDDTENFPSRPAIKAAAPLTSTHVAQQDTSPWMRTDVGHVPMPKGPQSAAVRMCMPSVFSVASRGTSIPGSKGIQYPGQAHSVNESSAHGRDHKSEGPLHHRSAMKLHHVQGGGHSADNIKHAVSSAVCKADEVLKSLRGNQRRYAELPLRQAAALANSATPALRLPQDSRPQPLQFWKGRSHSTPRPGTAPVAASPAVPAVNSFQADCAALKSGAPAGNQQPGSCRGAYGSYGSQSPAQAGAWTVNRALAFGDSSSPATSAVGTATPWAETLRSKLRQLRADRESTPKVGGSKVGKQAHNEANLAVPRVPEVGPEQGHARGSVGARQPSGSRAPVVTPACTRSRSAPGRNCGRNPVGHTAELCSSGPALEWRTRTPAAPTLRNTGQKLPAATGVRQAQRAVRAPSATRHAVGGLGQHWNSRSTLPPRPTAGEASTTVPRDRGAAALCQWRQRSPCISRLSPTSGTPLGPRAHSTARGRAVQRVPDAVSPKSMQAPGSARGLSWPRAFRSRSPQTSSSAVGTDRDVLAAVRHGKEHRAGGRTAASRERGWQRFLDRQPDGVPESAGAPTLAARLRAAQACIAADWGVGRHGRGPVAGTQEVDTRDLKHRLTMEGAGSRQQSRPVHGTMMVADVQARTTRTVHAAADKPTGHGLPAPCLVRPASEHVHVLLLC